MSLILLPSRLRACLVGALLLVASPALAWDISIGSNFLANALYIDSASGGFPTWTTIDERVRASDQPGSTVPISWNTQSWDGFQWPTDNFQTTDGVTTAYITHNDVTDEFFDSAEAFLFGSVAPGDAAGACFGYDFDLTLNPFSSASIFLDPLETFVYLESMPGDVGTGFAQLRLYDPTVDINAMGGVNNPWASDVFSHQPGDAITDTNATFSHTFVNGTNAAKTYRLRFDGTVAVFATPEPATLALIGMAAIAFGMRRQD